MQTREKNHQLKCDQCDKVFYRKGGLTWHKKYVHGDKQWKRPVYGAGNTVEFSSRYWNGFKVREKRTKLGYTESTYNISFKNKC